MANRKRRSARLGSSHLDYLARTHPLPTHYPDANPVIIFAKKDS